MIDLTITMLGASGAGKTCFLVGLYNLLRHPINYFQLCSINPETGDIDLDQDSQLEKMWERLQGTGADRWPAPTDASSEFTFALLYAYKRIITFNWLDYRGGALTDKSSESDVRELVARIGRSNAIFICVPGDALVGDSQSLVGDATRVAKTDRINLLLGQVRARASHDTPLPTVVIVLTKWDVCVEAGLAPNQIQDKIKRLFNPLFAVGGRWLVTICPVTLGAGLSRNRDSADIKPKHIHFPVTFVTCMELKERIEASRTEIAQLHDERRGLGGNWFMEWWNSQELGRNAGTLELEQAELARAEEDLGHLQRTLAAAVNVYYDGTERVYEL